MLQPRVALCKLLTAQNTLQLRDPVHGHDLYNLQLRLHLRVEELILSVRADRRLHLAQDHCAVSHLPAAQVQRRWKRCSELHRLHHDSRDFPYDKRLDLLQPLLLAHGHRGYYL